MPIFPGERTPTHDEGRGAPFERARNAFLSDTGVGVFQVAFTVVHTGHEGSLYFIARDPANLDETWWVYDRVRGWVFRATFDSHGLLLEDRVGRHRFAANLVGHDVSETPSGSPLPQENTTVRDVVRQRIHDFNMDANERVALPAPNESQRILSHRRETPNPDEEALAESIFYDDENGEEAPSPDPAPTHPTTVWEKVAANALEARSHHPVKPKSIWDRLKEERVKK